MKLFKPEHRDEFNYFYVFSDFMFEKNAYIDPILLKQEIMESYIVEASPKTPAVNFDPMEGTLLIKGRSNPENAREFFNPVIDWLDEYIKHPAEKTELTVNLEHFNTSSSKYLMEVLRKIRYLADNDFMFNVVWMYEDDDLEMLDTAEAYEMMTGMKFEKVSYPEHH